MQLLNLPNELTFTLLEYLVDTSLLNLALTAKSLHSVCEQELTKRKYSKHYKITTDNPQSGHAYPIQFIDLITDDPKIAQHCKQLIYREPDPVSAEIALTRERLMEKHDWLLPQITEFVDAGLISVDEAARWSANLKRGACIVEWLVLYRMLPNLELIAFDDIDCTVHDMLSLIVPYLHKQTKEESHGLSSTTMDATTDSSRDHLSPEVKQKPPTLSFPSPKTLGVSYGCYTTLWTLENMTAACLLPSVKKLHALHIPDGKSVTRLEWPGWVNSSPRTKDELDNTGKLTCGIRDVEIGHARISPNDLVTMVRAMPFLEEFVLHDRGFFRGNAYTDLDTGDRKLCLNSQDYKDTVRKLGGDLWRERRLELDHGVLQGARRLNGMMVVRILSLDEPS